MLRQRTGKHENLEQALFLWFNDVRSKNAIVNDDMLIEKAKTFGGQLGVQDFDLFDAFSTNQKEYSNHKIEYAFWYCTEHMFLIWQSVCTESL